MRTDYIGPLKSVVDREISTVRCPTIVFILTELTAFALIVDSSPNITEVVNGYEPSTVCGASSCRMWCVVPESNTPFSSCLALLLLIVLPAMAFKLARMHARFTSTEYTMFCALHSYHGHSICSTSLL
jgi:hypothetical protein